MPRVTDILGRDGLIEEDGELPEGLSSGISPANR
jgi:hypothetical protein